MSDAGSSDSSIHVLVLAAGTGTRFEDDDKLLAAVAGVPLIDRTLTAVLEVAPASTVRVVVAPHHESRAAIAAVRGAQVVVADHAQRGMRWSIAAALAALPPTATGAVVVLGDDPLAAGSLGAVLEQARAEPERVACVDRGAGAPHPVYVPRATWPEPPTSDDDSGLRALLGADPALVDAAGVASLDVDTTRDLQALEERLRRPTQ